MRTLIATLLLLSVAMSSECQKAVEKYKEGLLKYKGDSLSYYVNRHIINKSIKPIEALNNIDFLIKTYDITFETLPIKTTNSETICYVKAKVGELPKVSNSDFKRAILDLNIQFDSNSQLESNIDRLKETFALLKKHNLKLVKEFISFSDFDGFVIKQKGYLDYNTSNYTKSIIELNNKVEAYLLIGKNVFDFEDTRTEKHLKVNGIGFEAVSREYLDDTISNVLMECFNNTLCDIAKTSSEIKDILQTIQAIREFIGYREDDSY